MSSVSPQMKITKKKINTTCLTHRKHDYGLGRRKAPRTGLTGTKEV